uniref:G protein-coupled receptor n=1 Tax=Ditylenchus dipsaci TaxID=166011 RepID=A0A915DUR6_9BILA
MSVGTLLADRQTFIRYYNCTNYDVESISLAHRKHTFVGLLYITLGVVLESLYIPCIWALYKMFSNGRKTSSCYRLMFFLGCVDCVGLTVCAFWCGSFSLQGAVYCQQPIQIYASCTLGMTDRLFAGKRTLYTGFQCPLSIFCVIWLVPPVLFNSIDSSAIFNPHLHYLPDDGFYHSTVHLCFNWLIVIAIVVIYSLFGVFFYRKIRCSGGISQVKNNRRLLREISQYLASIPILVFTGYICHQGSPAVIYLCMNQSIRNSIFKGDKYLNILQSSTSSISQLRASSFFFTPRGRRNFTGCGDATTFSSRTTRSRAIDHHFSGKRALDHTTSMAKQDPPDGTKRNSFMTVL